MKEKKSKIKKINTSISLEVPKHILERLEEDAIKEDRAEGKVLIRIVEKQLAKIETPIKDETITKKNVFFLVPVDIKDKLDIIAHNQGVSRSQIVSKMLITEFETDNE